MPVQLVFGCEMVLNNPFIAVWEDIIICKQKPKDENNDKKIRISNRTIIEYMRMLLVHNKNI